MDAWLVWLIAAVVFAVGEIATLGFFLAPFSGGAIAALVVAAADGGGALQWAAFLVVSIVLLAALRPLARSHRRMPLQIRTGTAALIGRSGVVVERVATHQPGRVRVDGDEWTARPYDEDRVLEPGTQVQIMEIRGATALVAD